MPLVADDLLAPKGRVEGKSFFPDLSSTDLAFRLTEYLNQGYEKAAADSITDVDEAARHYAYYRVFEAVYLSLISNPLDSTTPEGGKATFSGSQADKFRSMANDELAIYTGLMPTPPVEIARVKTVFVPNQFVF